MKRHFSIFLIFVILLQLCFYGITTGSTAETKTSRLPDQNEVKALLVKLVDEEKRAPGMVIGMIADDPQERWVVGYGKLSDTDERVPDGDTVFEIGSISKPFTGTLLALAAVTGEVQLDDPISLYLPEGVVAPEYEGKSITLIDLATHTSGLPSFHASNPFEEYTVDQMYADLSGFTLARAPGTIHEYSNYGFGLLGNLLTRSAGQADYEALLLERICRPLGMNSTSIQVTPEMHSREAAPHDENLLPAGNYAKSAFAGSGGIRSTTNDMLTFLAANMELTKTELQPAIQLANKPYFPTDAFGYMGLGWVLFPTAEGTIHNHNGNTGGYYSYAAWDSQRKIGVVVLTNAAISIDDVGFQLFLGVTSGRPIPRSIEIMVTTWAIITAGCLAILIWVLWRKQPALRGARLMWLLTTLFMGPVGLVIYCISVGQPNHSGVSVEEVSPVRRALGSAAWASAGNVVGGIGVLALQQYLQNVVGVQIAVSLLIPLFVGWLVFAVSRWISRSEAEHDFPSRRPLFAEVISTCLVLIGLYPVVYYPIIRWINLWAFPFGGWHQYYQFYPPLWGLLCLGAITGTLVAYPFHLWMLRRGLFRWGNEAILEVSVRGLAWYVEVALMGLSFAGMLAVIFLVMQIA